MTYVSLLIKHFIRHLLPGTRCDENASRIQNGRTWPAPGPTVFTQVYECNSGYADLSQQNTFREVIDCTCDNYVTTSSLECKGTFINIKPLFFIFRHAVIRIKVNETK